MTSQHYKQAPGFAAKVLGKNENAVKALQYRAVKTLGRLLPEDLVA